MIRFHIRKKTSPVLFAIPFLVFSCKNKEHSYDTWSVYGEGSDNIKYSALRQIDTSNVKSLQVAWTHSAGESSMTNTTDMKTNAIVVNGTLYGLNPQLRLFGLDAATGIALKNQKPGTIAVPGF